MTLGELAEVSRQPIICLDSMNRKNELEEVRKANIEV